MHCKKFDLRPLKLPEQMAFSGRLHTPAMFVVNALRPSDLPSKAFRSMPVSTAAPLCDWRAESHLQPDTLQRVRFIGEVSRTGRAKRRKTPPRTGVSILHRKSPYSIDDESESGETVREMRPYLGAAGARPTPTEILRGIQLRLWRRSSLPQRFVFLPATIGDPI